MARRLLPVDGPVVHADDVLAQRLELGTVAPIAVDLETEDGVVGEVAKGGGTDRANVGDHRDGRGDRVPVGAAGQAERAGPAHRDGLDSHSTAALRLETKVSRTRAPGRDIDQLGGYGFQRLVDVAQRLDAQATGPLASGQFDHELIAITNVESVGLADHELEASDGQHQESIHRGEHHCRCYEAEPQGPQLGRTHGGQQGNRKADGQQEHAAGGWTHYRGATTRSRIRSMTRVGVMPSISAPGDSCTRWHRLGAARRLMSSGMT